MTPAAAMPFTALMGVAQYQAQGKIGKYNQAVNNRNAAVLEGQAAQIEQKAEFDIAQFQKDFRKMEGETTVALAKSGVELGTGTAYNIELSNAYEAKLQENLIKYNSEVLQQIKWKKQTLQELEVQWLETKLDGSNWNNSFNSNKFLFNDEQN
jgi:hypothetical protein